MNHGYHEILIDFHDGHPLINPLPAGVMMAVILTLLSIFHLKTTSITKGPILLMEEILHQLIGTLSVYPIIYKVLYIPGGGNPSINSVT